ncbi:MAG: hypothetical protein AAF846_14220 [Chloroflexota bacterium]
MQLLRCPSCDGYGWSEDDFTGEAEDCGWCAGIGYVFRDDANVDHKITRDQLRDSDISAQLEALDIQRMREIGYEGDAKKPWEQAIRKGTQGGINPYDDDSSD